jgi:antirestriction protein ArdC
MNLQTLRQLVKECVREAIILKRHEDNILAISDLDNPKDQSRETFKNKNKLKKAGFKWNPNVGAWSKPASDFSSAMRTASELNPAHEIFNAVEDLPEFIMGVDAVNKKKELAEKVDRYIDALVDDVEAAGGSEELQRFMDFNSKFRTYSWNNTLLIYIQRPTAKRVAGKGTWYKKFHRKLKLGAKGITIFAPMTKKVKEKDLDGMDKEQKISFFRPVTVFDIEDTEPIDERGEIPNLEWHADSEPNEVADKLTGLVIELATNMGVKITHDPSKRGEQGYSAGDKINLSSHIDGVEKSATLVHEIAHELLHHEKTSMFYDESNPSNDMRELQAESVAYLVLKHYDLPVKAMATYLALWKANKEKIIQDLPTLKKVANFIIEQIDKLEEKQEG